MIFRQNDFLLIIQGFKVVLRKSRIREKRRVNFLAKTNKRLIWNDTFALYNLKQYLQKIKPYDLFLEISNTQKALLTSNRS